MAMHKIRLNLELNPGSDRVYTITSPDVPGLVTEGSTPEEITRNVQECIDGLLEVWAAYNMPIPPALQAESRDDTIEVLVTA